MMFGADLVRRMAEMKFHGRFVKQTQWCKCAIAQLHTDLSTLLYSFHSSGSGISRTPSSHHAPNFHGCSPRGQYLSFEPDSSQSSRPVVFPMATQHPLIFGILASISKAVHLSVPTHSASSLLPMSYGLKPPFISSSADSSLLSRSGIGGCTCIVLNGNQRVFNGRAGTHVQGVRVHSKNGATPSPCSEVGGKTCIMREAGGDWPAGVGGAEKEKRARCLGMFQLRRPLYIVVRWDT